MKEKEPTSLKVKDVCELPKPINLNDCGDAVSLVTFKGYNQALSEIAELPVKLPVAQPSISREEIMEAIKPIPSTHHPICIIGKHPDGKTKKFYYMCKEDIATAILNHLESRKA